MPGLVDDIIGRKTKAKHYLDHPDAPDREDARLYYCHDAFGVKHDHERDQFQKMEGQAHNIDASDAVETATKMVSAKFVAKLFDKMIHQLRSTSLQCFTIQLADKVSSSFSACQ